MSKGTVLVIDDEKDLLELVRYNLEQDGYDAITATDGESGLEIARQERPNLIILDVMMPGMDGLEVCRELRHDGRTKPIPVIMLTAKAAETDRIVGLEMGADDYVTKPFSPRELIARVKAMFRRSTNVDGEAQAIRHGELMIDPDRHEVTFGSSRITLTATEFKIVHFLASRPGRVSSRDEIIDAAIGRDVAVTDRTIDVHMTAIRRKLGRGAEQIETVRGFGYRLRDAADVPT